MSKNINWTANSLNKVLSYKQFKTATQLLHSREINENHVLHPAKLDSNGKVVLDTTVSVPVSTILSFDMVPNENKPGEMRRNYKFLPNLNVVDASSLLDYLFSAPNKGSNNSTVQQTTAPLNTGGFGGAV